MANLDSLNNAFAAQSEQQAKRQLEQEGRRLKLIAVKIWRQYLASYKPKSYARTRNSQRGIKLGRVHRVDAFHFGIELTFENDLMYHDSVLPNSAKKGHSIMLISEGWNKEKKETKLSKMMRKQVYRFTYFEGIDYLGKVEKAFNAGKPIGITLETQWSEVYVK